jgi:uncharacterized peroxidase-related enzyme
MNRLHTVGIAEAAGPAAQVFSSIKAAIGAVPNAFLTVGSNSPLALSAALALDASVHKGSLSVKEIEVIKLAVSEVSNCDYCLAAHTVIGKQAGLSGEAVLAARFGQQSDNSRFDALSTFARALVGTSGTVPADVVADVRAEGYTDQQIVDALLAVTSITFNNLVNRVNDTPLDFPAAR